MLKASGKCLCRCGCGMSFQPVDYKRYRVTYPDGVVLWWPGPMSSKWAGVDVVRSYNLLTGYRWYRGASSYLSAGGAQSWVARIPSILGTPNHLGDSALITNNLELKVGSQQLSAAVRVRSLEWSRFSTKIPSLGKGIRSWACLFTLRNLKKKAASNWTW